MRCGSTATRRSHPGRCSWARSSSTPRHRRGGGPGTYFVPRCAPPGAPLPPAPPDAATIWQQTPLPRARIHSSPPGTVDWPGIVNLESRFWGDPLPDARATVTLDGYVVDVAAHPVAYGWAFDDGTTSVGSSPGSAGVPLRATFRRRGDHGARALRHLGRTRPRHRALARPRLRDAVPRDRHPARRRHPPRGRDPGAPQIPERARGSVGPSSECPALQRRRQMFKSIVVGTDGSARASEAVLAAAELAATQPERGAPHRHRAEAAVRIGRRRG